MKLVFSGSCWVVRSSADSELNGKPPFRDGIEYRYEWEASVRGDSAISDQVTTSIALKGQLYVHAKTEDSKWRALLRVT